MKSYLIFGVLISFSAVSILVQEISLAINDDSTLDSNKNPTTTNHSPHIADRCGVNPNIGPTDMCIVGNFDGRNFNRIVSMAHAFGEIQKLRNTGKQEKNGGDSAGLVRLTPKGMKWYHEWFDDDPTKVQLLTERCRPTICKMEKTWMDWFYLGRTAKDEEEKMRSKQRKQIALETTISGLIRKDYVAKAQQEIEKYRNMRGISENVKVVTVHARWIEGTCPHKAETGQNACEHPPSENRTNIIPSTWIQACQYTEDIVKQHLPAELKQQENDNAVVIVLLGDGQHVESESTFTIRDDNNFQIQTMMMVLSDYHFGNPQSSADAIIANWRKRRWGTKSTFPEDCFSS